MYHKTIPWPNKRVLWISAYSSRTSHKNGFIKMQRKDFVESWCKLLINLLKLIFILFIRKCDFSDDQSLIIIIWKIQCFSTKKVTVLFVLFLFNLFMQVRWFELISLKMMSLSTSHDRWNNALQLGWVYRQTIILYFRKISQGMSIWFITTYDMSDALRVG